MLSFSEGLIIALITALSAFPAVFFSLYLMFRRDRVQSMLLNQLTALPGLLKTRPEARTAVKQSAQAVMKDINTGLSHQIAVSAAEELSPAISAALIPVFEKQSQSLSGQFGQMIKKVKADLTSGGAGGGALDDIGSLIHTVSALKGALPSKTNTDEETGLTGFLGNLYR
jgi:flagellar biosynthesis component FlhA